MERASRSSLRLDLDKVKRPLPEICNKPTPGLLEFSDGQRLAFTAKDLEDRDCIGMGSYGGVVNKMIHRISGKVMAVKRVRAHEIDTQQREVMLRELDMIIRSQPCEDIVRFYGALFQDGDCWICMELLDCSLDKFYRNVYEHNERLPENIVGFIAAGLVRALSYLKEKLEIIHRDVKPSNILLDRRGFVKLCDFGISGYLVDSIAKTQDVGCRVYLAPERLSNESYDIRSDVWSLGISLIEICIGRFPYVEWCSVFEQIQAVVCGDPPLLKADQGYSIELVSFVNRCIIKEKLQRPKYTELATDPFFRRHNHQADATHMRAERDAFGAYVTRFLPPPAP